MSENEIKQYGKYLKNKTAVVTGASSGIGRAIAELFAKEGASVAIMDINEKDGKILEDKINESGGKSFFIKGDVSSPEDCRSAVSIAAEKYGGLDILVNNAGIIKRTTVLDIDENEWDKVMAVNVRSVFLMSKYAIPEMIKRNGGSIINIGSGWGLVGGGKAVSYCASKGAVVQMTRAMAIDHGGQNIRVNCVCPGDVDTPMLRDEAEQLGEDIDKFMTESLDRPLKRNGKPEDIAHAVLYLAGSNSSYVTGSILVVDGGGLAG
ncbi:SDR family NAD(P)-dependent oxidoreductase [candidate division KSB1 bacterium]